MDSYTTNINLILTPSDADESFHSWRSKINGESDSNMVKIDAAIGSLSSTVGQANSILEGALEGGI